MGAPRPHLDTSGRSGLSPPFPCVGTAVALGCWSEAGGSWCPREQRRALGPLGPSHGQSFGATCLDFPGGAHGEGAAGAARLRTTAGDPQDPDLARRGAALGFEEKCS